MSNETSRLEEEIEETRERLASTIDQLLHRSSPKTIVGRELYTIRARYVDVETGQPRTDNILKTAGAVVGVIAALVVIRKLAR